MNCGEINCTVVLRCDVDSCVRTLDTSCWWSARTIRHCPTSSRCSCRCRTRWTVCVILYAASSLLASSSSRLQFRPPRSLLLPRPPRPALLPRPLPSPRQARAASWRHWPGRSRTICGPSRRRPALRRCLARAAKLHSDFLILTANTTSTPSSSSSSPPPPTPPPPFIQNTRCFIKRTPFRFL